MSEIIIQAAQAGDLPAIAKWTVEICQAPAQQCIHSWSGQDADALYTRLIKSWNDKELMYRIAMRGGEIMGMMGSEYDETLGRAWLHGPNVAAAHWAEAAPLLYRHVLDGLPRPIIQLDTYLNTENVRGLRFYTERDFEEIGYSCEYSLAAPDRVDEISRGCPPLQEQQQKAFIQLYETIFPTGYHSGERIVSMIGLSHQVFTLVEAGQLRGFVVVCLEADAASGEVQFLGVQEGWRGQGFGRNLLMTGANWLFKQTGVTQVSLNVWEKEVQPRLLYESVGFRSRFRGTALCKMLRERER